MLWLWHLCGTTVRRSSSAVRHITIFLACVRCKEGLSGVDIYCKTLRVCDHEDVDLFGGCRRPAATVVSESRMSRGRGR